MTPPVPSAPFASSAAVPPLWLAAGPADAPALLALMRAFYAEERLRFDEATQGAAARDLLARPELGAVFLLRAVATGPAVDAPPAPLGHLVLTWACSLEFGGRFVLLDELYLAPALRGRGEGRRAVEFATAWARGAGAPALRLEVDRENIRARATYGRAGFGVETRDLMTLRFPATDALRLHAS